MSRLMTSRRLRAIVASLMLGAATSAFALNTATIVSSALSPDCLEYRVVGICYWLYCTPVSYTHLDVYKRQPTPWGSSPNAITPAAG